jgi:hypothetical protein
VCANTTPSRTLLLLTCGRCCWGRVCVDLCVVSQEAVPLLQPEQPVSVSVVQGSVVTEIRQTWASWASLTTRLYAGRDTLEQVGAGFGWCWWYWWRLCHCILEVFSYKWILSPLGGTTETSKVLSVLSVLSTNDCSRRHFDSQICAAQRKSDRGEGVEFADEVQPAATPRVATACTL